MIHNINNFASSFLCDGRTTRLKLLMPNSFIRRSSDTIHSLCFYLLFLMNIKLQCWNIIWNLIRERTLFFFTQNASARERWNPPCLFIYKNGKTDTNTHMQKIVQNDADKQVMQRQNVLLFCGLLFPRIQHDVEMLTFPWNRFGRVIGGS